jgi:hypothetical protein
VLDYKVWLVRLWIILLLSEIQQFECHFWVYYFAILAFLLQYLLDDVKLRVNLFQISSCALVVRA